MKLNPKLIEPSGDGGFYEYRVLMNEYDVYLFACFKCDTDEIDCFIALKADSSEGFHQLPDEAVIDNTLEEALNEYKNLLTDRVKLN